MQASEESISVAQLLRDHPTPPEAVLVDWAAQVMGWMMHSQRAGQPAGLISEETLLVDRENRLQFPAVNDTSSQGLSDKPHHRSDVCAVGERLIRKWHAQSHQANPCIDQAWQHVFLAIDALGQDPENSSHEPETIALQLDAVPPGQPGPSGPAVPSVATGVRSQPQATKRSRKTRHRKPLLVACACCVMLLVSLAAWAWMGPSSQRVADVASNTAAEVMHLDIATNSSRVERSNSSRSETDAPIGGAQEMAASNAGDTADQAELQLLVQPNDPEPSVSVELNPSEFMVLAGDAPALSTLGTASSLLVPAPQSETPRSTEMPGSQEEPSEDPSPPGTLLPGRTITDPVELMRYESIPVELVLQWPEGKELSLTREANQQDWLLVDDSQGQNMILARIVSDGQTLQWQWSKQAGSAPLATSIPNARMIVRGPSGREAFLELRLTQRFDTWRPRLEQGEAVDTWNLGMAPGQQTQLTITCMAPEKIQFQSTESLTGAAYRRGQGEMLFTSDTDLNVAVRMQFEWTASRRLTLRTTTDLRLDPRLPWWSCNIESLDQRARNLAQTRFVTQQQHVAVKAEYSSTRREPQRTQLKQQRDTLAATLAQVDAISLRMASARALLHDLEIQGQWQVVLATPWHDHAQSILVAGKLSPTTAPSPPETTSAKKATAE